VNTLEGQAPRFRRRAAISSNFDAPAGGANPANAATVIRYSRLTAAKSRADVPGSFATPLPRSVDSAVFDPAQWEALTDPASVPVADLALGVGANPSRDTATVCLAGRRADGRTHIEWYASGPGGGAVEVG
jgi:hypothetical protein